MTHTPQDGGPAMTRRIITTDLPYGWSIAQDQYRNKEEPPLQIFKDGVHVASGVEYSNDRQRDEWHWVVRYIAAPETRNFVMRVMDDFRAAQDARHKASADAFIAKIDAERGIAADAARRVIIGTDTPPGGTMAELGREIEAARKLMGVG